MHNAYGTFSVALNKFYFAYQHTFTGSAKGINETLSSFHVGKFRVQYEGNLKELNGTLFFNINNIWDADYQVIERRPMPGIHFETGVNLKFNKKINTK